METVNAADQADIQSLMENGELENFRRAIDEYSVAINDALPQIAVKSDYEQWYDAAFAPSDFADDYFRRIKADNPLPWVIHKDIEPSIEAIVKEKVVSFFVEEGGVSISPDAVVEGFDTNGERMGVWRYSEMPSSVYWVRKIPDGLVGAPVIRVWRFGVDEAVIYSEAGDVDIFAKAGVNHRLVDLYSLNERTDRTASQQHAMLYHEFIKDPVSGHAVPWGQQFSPDVDGLGLEDSIPPERVYASISAWKVVVDMAE